MKHKKFNEVYPYTYLVIRKTYNNKAGLTTLFNINDNNSGIGQLEAICRNVLARYVVRGFINENYKTNFPREDQVSTTDKQNRIYQSGTFEAELSGAIELVRITGILSLNLG